MLGVYTRRLLVLLGFGVLHVALLWWGDVLWTYAIAGFGLLLFHRASNRTRVIAALVLMFVPAAVYRLPGVWLRVFEMTLDPANLGLYNDQMIAAMHGFDYVTVMKEHVQFAWVWSAGSWPQYLAWILGHFLLGYVAGTLRWFERDGAEHLPAFRRLLIAGLACGAAGTAMVVAMHAGLLPAAPRRPDRRRCPRRAPLRRPGRCLRGGRDVAGQRPRWRRVLAVLAPVGGMPLTTYFLQSLICTFLLYGWGLGWIG